MSRIDFAATFNHFFHENVPMVFRVECACGVFLSLALATISYPAGTGDPPANTGDSPLKEFKASLSCVALSPDGKTIAVGGSDFPGPGEILVVDRASGRKLWASSKHWRTVWSLSFSPDGKLLASGGDGGEVNLWDAATGKHRAALVGHRVCVNSLMFSPEGTALISGGSDNFVKVWDVATGKTRATFRFPFRDERKTHDQARFPELPEEHAKLTVDFKGPVEEICGVALSPDGKTLAAATAEKEVMLWSVTTGVEVAVIVTDHANGVIRVEFSPDGKVLATGGGRKDGSIRLWDIKTGKRIGVLEGHEGPVLGLTFAPDGKTLVSACRDHTAKVWDALARKERASVTPRADDDPRGLALSPDGKWFVTVGGPNSVRRYRTEDGKELPIGE